ncbi:PKD domain-containing protein [Chitinophaga rhizophila]|uniref:PKD domain-containing protein n=1 Tax=Chitinophaga rhizophila TaxID=2866212 RepID=A0ABS7GDA3_9BACT|nr:PKD domain-containing protein [Chitinophaga rhizophila]MBW8685401.1 PKD domain-containing protein [Chitinophaga rhizophila]
MKHHYLRQLKHILRAVACFIVLFLFSGARTQAQNTVAFTADNWTGCGAVFVQFVNQSTPVGTASWDFGDGGARSTLWNPSRTFNRPGTFNVVLTVTFPNGQTASTQHIVNVYARPTVQFSSTQTTGCTPLTVNFRDQSTAGDGTISNISWDFGDGNGATGSTASHTYNRGGGFVATSIVTNSFGCTGSGSQVIQANPTPEVAFTSNTQGGCRTPTTVNFTNTTTLNTAGPLPAVNYTWDFGDGTTSTDMHPSHDYTTTGNFNVSLTATTADGCTRTVTIPNYIRVATMAADFNIASRPCTGGDVTFRNTTLPAPVSATWTFSDGQVVNTIDAVKNFTTAGTYSVTMRAITQDGCEAIVTRDFTISTPPDIDFTMNPTSSCAIPVNIQFTTSGTGADTWAWDFGDGGTSALQNPLHNYTAEGDYSIKAVATNAAGCVDSVTHPITIRKPTLTIIGDNRGCVPFNASFTATVSGTDPIASYNWSFGDGTTSTDATALHTYTRQNRYVVTLDIVTVGGCTQTATYEVRVGRPVIPDFTVDRQSGCQPTIFNFTDLSTQVTGMSWEWTFYENTGANGTSNQRNPSYVFNSHGLHDVSLTINNNGCIRTTTRPAYIEVFPPVAFFTVGTVDCNAPLVRSFTDASEWGADTLPRSYTWDFGDGTTDNTPNPSHTFPGEGTYTVVLTVSNTVCTSTYSTTVRVLNEKPVIAVDQDTICLGTRVNFSTPSIVAGSVASYRWTYGDGRFNTSSPRPGYTYSTPGRYPVALATIDIYGCRHVSDTLFIEVNGATARFTASARRCRNEAITFTDASTVRTGNTITSWTYDFGDGTPPQVFTTQPVTVNHSYSVINDYQVILTVTDNTGCVDTAMQTISIANIVANFSANTNIACLNTPFQFNNESITEPLTYAWSFGDGGISTDRTPRHTYTAPGRYTVTLDVTNATGCTARTETVDFVRVPNPVADFSAPIVAGDICPPVNVQFTNLSSDYERLSWSFGDGSSSDEENPVHNYIRPGLFPVTLIAYSEGGCASAVAGPREISIAGPDGSFSVSVEAGCVPLTTSMTAVSPTAQRFIWDFGDGYTVRTTTPASPSYTYLKEGVYFPVVLLEDERGCTVPAAGNPKVVVDKITAAFGMDITHACDGGIVYFSDSTRGVSIEDGSPATFLWDFGIPNRTDDVATGPNPSFLFDTPGTYTVRLTATSRYGCVSDTTMQLIIEESPMAGIIPVAPVCLGTPVQLAGIDTMNLANTSWNWSSNGIQYPMQTPGLITYTQPGIYPVQLIITSASGRCMDTATIDVQVAPYPTLNLTPAAASICRGESVNLQASTEAGVTINWTDYNISDPTSPSPVVTPDRDFTYHVTAVNATGCAAEGDVRITVSQPFSLQANNADVCTGGAVQLNATGAVTYKWSPATGLNNTDISNPMATPETNMTYQVVGYGNDNCFTDTAIVTVTIHDAPTVNAGDDMTIPTGTTIQLPVTGSTDISAIEWTPAYSLNCADCLSPLATPRENTTYHVTVRNAYGCTAMDDVTINLVCSSGTVFLPNTFSPNNDGQNDLFYIRGKGIKQAKSFKIYNRWGQLIFERTNFNIEDPSFGWDGRVNGLAANPDVFVYVAELLCDSNEDFTIKGNVMLIR